MHNYYDMPDPIWEVIESILPTEGSPKGGRPAGDLRNFLNALYWILCTGGPWRALPEKYGPWKTIYSRFRRWQERGYFTAIFELLALDADKEILMIDGTYIHAHKHSFGARKCLGNQALGVSRGGHTSKIHALVDGLGNLISFVLTGGECSDVSQAYGLLERCGDSIILADKGYDSERLVSQLERHGCTAVIPTKCNSLKPRLIDKHLYKERHLVENFFNKIKEFRKIATRYDKLAAVYSAFVCFTASILWLR